MTSGPRHDAADVSKARDTAPAAQRKSLLDLFVLNQTLRIMGRDASDAIDPDKALSDLGLDSLMAVELRNALGQGLALALPATLVFDYPTLAALGAFLAGELELTAAPAQPQAKRPAAETATEDLLNRIENLRDEDIDRMLNEQDGVR